MDRIIGTYVQNRLEGKGKLVTQDHQISDCFFRHSSLHGPLRRFKLKKFREFRQQLDFVGTYRSGKPSGVCWQYREGGGWLVGTVDPRNGEFTGETGITYLYPDLYTALTGAFRNGVMTAASTTHLIDVKYGRIGRWVFGYNFPFFFSFTFMHVPTMPYKKNTFLGVSLT